MSWVLYALLPEGSPPHSLEELMARVEAAFPGEREFTARIELQPLARSPSIHLDCGRWGVNLHYSEDSQAREDVLEIARRLGDKAPAGLQDRARYVYAVFGHDPTSDYLTLTVDLMAFLQRLDGALVFDPQHNRLLA